MVVFSSIGQLNTFGVVLFEPIQPFADVVVQAAPPAVAAFIGLELYRGAALLQLLDGLLRHLKRAHLVIRRMVEEVSMAFGLVERWKELGFENRHGYKRSGN